MNHNLYWFVLIGIMTVFPLALFPSITDAGDEPELPAGLEDQTKSTEPELPAGLGIEEEPDAEVYSAHTPQEILSDLNGFLDARIGLRTQNDPHEKDFSLGEIRLQGEAQKDLNNFLFSLTTDFLYDPVLDHHTVRLEEGDGFIDIREASVLFSPLEFVDIKSGRQILTWGTGDLLFLNDLFPKDWKSFFIGRDVEYLKAPSDALKISVFTDMVDVDMVYTPRFDSDRFIEGERISFWNNILGSRSGSDEEVEVIKPDQWFRDSELALRISKNIRGYELSVYGYHGFWKSPGGFDPDSGKAIFPDLSVYGMSVRGKLLNGIGNLEFAYYETGDDKDGDDPSIKNSEFRNLLGYEQEIASDLTLGIQYYIEYMLHYNRYLDYLPDGSVKADECRHVITIRISKLLMNQNLKISLFTFYSPSDEDAYLRPLIHYKINDSWTMETGGNIFLGEEDYTFFAQFEKNNNIYMGIRYSF